MALIVSGLLGAVVQRVHHRARQTEREHCAENDRERQQQAPVGEQKDQQHWHERHTEQQAVDAGEGIGQIGLTRRGAGDLRHRPWHACRTAHLVENGRQFLAEVRLQRDDGLHRPAVLGDQSRRGLPDESPMPGESPIACVAADRCAEVMRPSFAVHTTIAGTVSDRSNALPASSTRVDSALPGRKTAWSWVATSPSLPA
ncbi:hypothetical protein GCM10012285_27760 [Streptomyces kronopolitis]|uniref:Secreted protein n=1 Tax=Streptomyces kronopolitis TaxID=1612435 RepID=A0ABQ2JEB3_9ACTN|nr:hypothetical protein GCM10012285_27760 [Streptomyces kronopolitis]